MVVGVPDWLYRERRLAEAAFGIEQAIVRAAQPIRKLRNLTVRSSDDWGSRQPALFLYRCKSCAATTQVPLSVKSARPLWSAGLILPILPARQGAWERARRCAKRIELV
jgi:hypothetical protein